MTEAQSASALLAPSEPPDPLEAALEVPPFEDKPIPLWQKLAGAAVLVVVVALIIGFHHRLSADFYPLDASRVAPNILASLIQWALVFLAAVLIWPPTRRRLHRFVDRKLDPVHAHLTHIRHHHEHANRQREQLDAKLERNFVAAQHIARHHPDIPDIGPDGHSLVKVTEPTVNAPAKRKATAKKAPAVKVTAKAAPAKKSTTKKATPKKASAPVKATPKLRSTPS